MQGFGKPDSGGTAMARFIQILGNYEGPSEPWLISFNRAWRFSGAFPAYSYEIKGWEIDDEDWCKKLKQYNLERFIINMDAHQPKNMQLGESMVHSLFIRDGTVNDLAIDYFYEVEERRRQGVKGVPFEENKTYIYYKNVIKVIEKREETMVVEYQEKLIEVPIYRWKDGSESTVIMDTEKLDKHPFVSTKRSDDLLNLLDGFSRSMEFNKPDYPEEDEEGEDKEK